MFTLVVFNYLTMHVIKKFLSSLVLSLAFVLTFSQVSVSKLRCENLVDPLGIDLLKPRLSWQLTSVSSNVMQTAYEVRLSLDSTFSNNLAWSSGRVQSDQSLYISYGGPALQSAKKYFWQAKVWDNKGNVSKWSQPAFWQMGLLQSSDWKASWIVSPVAKDSVYTPALLFRKTFPASKPIRSASVFITSHGMYEAQINGNRVGDAYLTPGWTSYNKRLQYQVYDVTSLLKTGDNAIGVTIGSGWYRTPLGWENNKNFYGGKIALLLQLEISYTDGSKETVSSDKSWKTSDGPIRVSEIYGGETYDANFEKTNWSNAAYNDKAWANVDVENYKKDILVSTYNQPVKKHETFKPLKIITTPKGEHVIDFGQNLVGWSQIKVNGKAGDKIIISHAEVLDKFGNFYTDNLRAAKAQNTFILKGNGEEIF